jgi:hypothetical protein
MRPAVARALRQALDQERLESRRPRETSASSATASPTRRRPPAARPGPTGFAGGALLAPLCALRAQAGVRGFYARDAHPQGGRAAPPCVRGAGSTRRRAERDRLAESRSDQLPSAPCSRPCAAATPVSMGRPGLLIELACTTATRSNEVCGVSRERSYLERSSRCAEPVPSNRSNAATCSAR